ncbi:hypothetical protein LTR96_011260 [Exophiala xenobiotica]|nr:hypothetical protein LTR41_011476 [Exophiala xenobiotica]KAK5219779.1 hypothetical protein LTR47_011423 [Exophiala xenobiotica]KAK5242108.1 hypothetical protein LTS06_011730 [Exophiala xenobiotica]KAK5260799.1 hypothetical protein LTR40_003465 [Exophiala xenobiotica]KAK5263323.1 hypothetical protein LTR96_011260 [Exophiala xenobiotica]
MFIVTSPFSAAEMPKVDYQVLAPSIDAISNYLRLSGLSYNDTNAIFEAWVTYHVLHGPHSKNQLQVATQFIPTLLTDANYTNVTGGQRVEAQSSGEQVYILSGNNSRSNIVQADIIYSGTQTAGFLVGFIHIIDKLLTIPVSSDAAITNAHLRGLAQAIGELPPDPRLSAATRHNDWTFFAPNSSGPDVFAVMSSEDIYELQAYHIHIGLPVYSTDLTDGLKLQTLQGEDVTISVINGTIYVNAVKIIDPDYLLDTGVMHLIDTTLNPNDTSGRPPSLNSSSAVPPSSSTSSLSTGAKAGIGIGAAISGLLLLSLPIFLFRRHKRHQQRAAIPQLDSREKGGLYEVQGKSLQICPTEVPGDQAFRGELESTTERSTTVHELD